MSIIDITPGSHIIELDEGDVLRTTIEATDALGFVHTARVTWMPQPLTGLDENVDDLGMTKVAWADECPVFWEAHRQTRVMRLCERIRQYTAQVEMIVRAEQVESIRDLTPGTYYTEIAHSADDR